MKTPTETVANNLERAIKMVAAQRQILAEAVAEEDRGAVILSNSVSKLAEAEGSRDFWSRMLQAARYSEEHGEGFTESVAMGVALSMVGRGADDSWSGRGNDTKRAYFDGVRSASHKIEEMF